MSTETNTGLNEVPIVYAEPYLLDLTIKFLNNRRMELPDISVVIKTGNFETLCSFGHGLKGAGASYGFEPITQIGSQIEEAAKNRQVSTIIKLVEELSEYLNKVIVLPELPG